MKKILIIVPDGGMLFESAGIADILMQANRLHPEGAREICYQVKLATTQPHQVIHGQSGLNLLADHRLHEIDPRELPGKPALRQRGTSRKPAWPPRGSVWSRLTRRWIVSPSKRDFAAVLTCDACLRNSLTSLQVNIVNDFTVAKWRKVILFCHLRHNPSVLL